ncbi:hypothetical protein D3C75_661030 [compost metagenome]
MAGEVDEHQVFGATALGQGAGGAGKVFTRGHGAGGHVIAVVDQGHLATGAKAHLEHVADVVGFAHEHALLAIAAHHQAVQLDWWRRLRYPGQRFVQQTALVEQRQVQRVGQQLAVLVPYAHAVAPGAAFDLAIGHDQPALAVVGIVEEATDVLAAVGQLQAALARQAPVGEGALVVAAIAAQQFAFADQRAVLEFADPHITIGVFVAATAFQAVVLELTDVLLAVDAVVGAAAFQLAVDEVAAELVAAGIAAHPGTVGLALGEQALVAAAVGQFQLAGAFVQVVLELAAVGLVGLLEGAFAVAAAVAEGAGIVAAWCGQVAQALE